MKSEVEMSAILNLIGLDIKKSSPYSCMRYCKVCNRKYKTETACYRHIDDKHNADIRAEMNRIITATNNEEG